MSTVPQDHESSTFVYEFKSGKRVELPAFQSLMTFGRARRLRKLDEAEQTFALVEEVCGEDSPEIATLDEMDLEETAAFFSAWQSHSGVSVGESSGSSA